MLCCRWPRPHEEKAQRCNGSVYRPEVPQPHTQRTHVRARADGASQSACCFVSVFSFMKSREGAEGKVYRVQPPLCPDSTQGALLRAWTGVTSQGQGARKAYGRWSTVRLLHLSWCAPSDTASRHVPNASSRSNGKRHQHRLIRAPRDLYLLRLRRHDRLSLPLLSVARSALTPATRLSRRRTLALPSDVFAVMSSRPI